MQKPASYKEFENYIKSVIPDFSSIENFERGESGNQLIVRFEQRNPDRNLAVEFKRLSVGEKCFFLSAYMGASNAFGPPIVCFRDEPDNHLSLSEVGHFITSLRKMVNKRGQFIATSHHPETLRKFSQDNTLVLTRKSHPDPTVVGPLSDDEYSGDLVNALMRDEIIG